MKMFKLVTLWRPKGIRDHPTDHVVDHELDIGNNLQQLITTEKKLLHEIHIYILGTATEEIQRPQISSLDCFWILFNLHLNVRFITQYIDLCLEWGGFIVWIIYTLTNVTICAWLALMYTFQGSYGDRQYLGLWDMMPIFSGIAYSVTVFDALKIVETGLIVSSGFMSFSDFLNSTYVANNPNPMECNKSKRAFIPAFGVQYGLSKQFTSYGYNSEGNNLDNWTINTWRVKWMVLIFTLVIVIRTFQFKRYKYFPLRVNAIASIIVLIGLTIMMSVIKNNPLEEIIQYDFDRYLNLMTYMQVIIFAIHEYLPMHWVTIGYLCPQHSLNKKIWIIAALKVAASFFILYCIPFVASDFQIFTNMDRSECLDFFGIHFLFVMVPISLKVNVFPALMLSVYVIYMLTLTFLGITYMLISIELFSYALITNQKTMYRYRNLIYVLISLILFFISYPFCITNVHYFMFHLNTRSHYCSVMIILTLTTLGFAIYGLERINGDHLFMRGYLYPNITSIKILFLVIFVLILTFSTQLYFEKYREKEENHLAYIILIGCCTGPLLYGLGRTCKFKSMSYKILQPLRKWGMNSAVLRNQRRRETLHTMYTYRMKRDCAHNCLLDHPLLMKKIDENLDEQERLLGLFRLHILKLAIDKQSQTSSVYNTRASTADIAQK